MNRDGQVVDRPEFLALRENDELICTVDDDDLFRVAPGLKFSIVKYIKNFPVFYTKVTGVTFSDQGKSRQVSIQQLAAYKNIQNSKYHVILETSSSREDHTIPIIDSLATKVLISAQVEDSFPLENKMVGFLPRQLPRILTILKKWYKVDYIIEVNSIRSNLTGKKIQPFPCSVALVLSPQVYESSERIAPQVRTLNMSGMNLSQIRQTLTKKNRNR
jgi:hypothetical protein